MSTGKAEEAAAVSAAEQRVVDYLRHHGDFFVRNAGLLTELEIPHPCGKAVSLIEYQVAVLREHNHQLRHRLQELIANARDNEELSRRLHRLTLGLMECTEIDQIFSTLYEALRDDFAAERVAVRLFVAPRSESQRRMAEFAGDQTTSRALFHEVLETANPLCGRLRREQLDLLFGADGGTIGSGVLLPLGVVQRIGVLAIGSCDERRFHPGMGTVFLRHLADVASHVMQPYLAAPGA